MGYKTIDPHTQVLKGSVIPAKVIEEQRKQQRMKIFKSLTGSNGGDKKKTATKSGGDSTMMKQHNHTSHMITASGDVGSGLASSIHVDDNQNQSSNKATGGWFCERLNQNFHRWFENKFNICPQSAKKQQQQQQPQRKTSRRVHVQTPTVYVDCSNMWDYDMISLNKYLHHSAVIDRDVNNSFCVIPSRSNSLATSPATSNNKKTTTKTTTTSEKPPREFENDILDQYDVIEIAPSSFKTDEFSSPSKLFQSALRRRDQRSNSSTSIKSRFEKRLGRIKKIGDENKIAESGESDEKKSVALSVSTMSREPVTFSSIFGDSSLFESELEESRIDESHEDESTAEGGLRTDSDLEDEDDEDNYNNDDDEIDQINNRAIHDRYQIMNDHDHHQNNNNNNNNNNDNRMQDYAENSSYEATYDFSDETNSSSGSSYRVDYL